MKKIYFLLISLILLVAVNTVSVFGQCSSTSSTSIGSCSSAWFTSITASGTGVTSTISAGSSSCGSTYYNYYSSQGVTAPTGSTVVVTATKTSSRYSSDFYIYVDWDNDGNFVSSEFVGTVMTLNSSTSYTATDSFTIPTRGIVTNTNLHMRVYHSEPAYSMTPPCDGRYGEADDFYLNATCTAPSLTLSPSYSLICGGTGSATLNVSGGGSAAIYEWSPSSSLSASTGSTVTATPSSTTIYTVEAYGGGVCDTTINDTVSVGTSFTPVVTATGSTTFCPGGTANLTESSGGATGWQWFIGATPIAGATNSNYTPSVYTTTTYTVHAIARSGCTGTANYTITILPLPTDVVTVTGPSTVCSPGTIALSASSGAGYSYQWLNSTGAISGATNINYTAAVTGGYRVQVTSAGGCQDTSSVTNVTVNPKPVATITASGSLTACSYDSVVLTAAAGYSYQWLDGTTILTGATRSTYVERTPGTYNLRVIVTNAYGCADTSASGSFNVTVYNPLVVSITSSGTDTFCVGGSVSLSVPNIGGYSYQWDSSVYLISGATNNSYVASTTGAYRVYVTDNHGCSEYTNPVSVRANPSPSAITGTSVFCQGSTVALTDTLTGGSWSSSNTAIATVNTSGIVTGVGSGSVSINYAVFGCPAVKRLTVNPTPGAIITPVGDTMLCPGDFVTLTANTGTGLTYQWYNSTGLISGETNDYYMTTSGSNYRVSVANTYGCVSNSPYMSVSVNPVTATLDTIGTAPFCFGSSIQMDANIGTGLSYQWLRNGAGIAFASTAVFYATDSGNYEVVVSNGAGCTATSPSIYVGINPSPVNTITVSGPLSFCSGDSITITGDTAAGLTYQWMQGGANIPGASSLHYTARTTGNYQLVETNGFGCSSNSAIAAVTSVPAPNASIATSGLTTFCAGSSVTLSATSAGAGTTYQWYQGGSPIAGAVGINYVATTTGAYTVRVTTAGGCTNISPSATRVIEVTTPNIIPYSNTTFCWGASVLLSLDVTGATGVQFQWQVGGSNITGATNSTFNADRSGNYSCIITLASGCTAASYAVTVTELPLPNPIVTYDGTFLNTGNFYVSYEWFRDLTPLSGGNSSKFHPNATGDYTVKVIDSNGCQSTSTIYVLRSMNDPSFLGVNNINASEISVYPNPTRNIVNIVSPVALTALVETIDGRRLMSEANATAIDISSLADGVYMLKLLNNDGAIVKTEKLVKR